MLLNATCSLGIGDSHWPDWGQVSTLGSEVCGQPIWTSHGLRARAESRFHTPSWTAEENDRSRRFTNGVCVCCSGARAVPHRKDGGMGIEVAQRRRQGDFASREERPVLPAVWMISCKAGAVHGKVGWGTGACGGQAMCPNSSLQIVGFIGTHSANKDVARNIPDRSGDFCLERGFDLKRNLGSVMGRILFLQNVF